jgi:hypothetical protein
MATRDLKELIKCSNYAATSGQSFKNNVAGAVSGAKMTDYIVTGWNWTGGPAGADVFRQDTGHIYSMVGTFLGGSRISNIIRQGSGLLAISSVTINAGGSVTLNSNNVTSSATASADVEIIAPYNPGATVSMSADAKYYYSGSDQASPPSSGYCQAHFAAVVTGGGASPDGGYDNVSFYLSMSNVNAYTGNFNDNPAPLYCVAATNHRGISPSDFTVEWHLDSAYTSLQSGNPNYFVDESVIWPSAPDPSGYTLYLRYKGPGVSTWTNYGAVTFIDSRIMY